MRRHLLIPAFVAFTALLGFDTASAAPAGFPARAVSLDLKQADIREVFEVIGKIAGREVSLDPCVQGTVDLRLLNTPLTLVLDALGAKLRLEYEDDGATLRVHCADSAADAAATPKVSFAFKGIPLSEALEGLAKEARLDGVDYRARSRPNVDASLRSVRLTTALAALSDESGLRIKVAKNRLVVND